MGNRMKKTKMTAPIVLFALTSIVVISLAYGCASREVVPSSIVVEQHMVLGPRTWAQWQAEAGWSTYAAGGDDPPKDQVQRFAQLVQAKGATFILFGGSWCPDSKAEVPVIYRLFELAGIPADRIQLYGVDRDLKEPTHTAQQYNISRIPTLIVLSNGKEIGRIAEFPVPTWSDNLISILSG